MKTESAINLNESNMEGTIGRPRIAMIFIGLIVLILFGFFIHGVQNLDSRSTPGTGGILTRKTDTSKKEVGTESLLPEYAQFDSAEAPDAIVTVSTENETETEQSTLQPEDLLSENIDDYRADPEELLISEAEENIIADAIVAEPRTTAAESPQLAARQAFLKQYYSNLTNNQSSETPPPPALSDAEVSIDGTNQPPINDILSKISNQPAPILPQNIPEDIQRYNFQNALEDKHAFVSNTQGGIYNSEPPHSAPTPLILRQGTIIPFILERTANSDLPGHIQAIIPDDIYDSIRNLLLLIPKGSRFVFAYNSNVRFGQERLQIAARRLLLPNQTSVLLDGATVYDAHGQSGLGEPDIKIDNHYDKLLQSGLIAGLLTYGTNSLGQNSNEDLIGSLAESLGQSTETAGEIILRRTLDKQPTLIAEIGTTGFVLLTRDLILPPYHQ